MKTRKQERVEVPYRIADKDSEIGCMMSRICGATDAFKDLAERLPALFSPPENTTVWLRSNQECCVSTGRRTIVTILPSGRSPQKQGGASYRRTVRVSVAA